MSTPRSNRNKSDAPPRLFKWQLSPALGVFKLRRVRHYVLSSPLEIKPHKLPTPSNLNHN